jgi:hypothetical protein
VERPHAVTWNVHTQVLDDAMCVSRIELESAADKAVRDSTFTTTRCITTLSGHGGARSHTKIVFVPSSY